MIPAEVAAAAAGAAGTTGSPEDGNGEDEVTTFSALTSLDYHFLSKRAQMFF